MSDEYESMLESAYEEVKPVEFCDRFEVKKVEGHHEGTKTIITNFFQVASCLRREQNHLAKFLFRELATNGLVEKDRLVLNRKLPSKLINEKIDKYVSRFVICNKCGKPDTELVDESNKTMLKCLACGNKNEVHNE